MSGKGDRPNGWEWTHERQAALIKADGLMCESHPGVEWPHGDCAGPGMPWMIEGREAITSYARIVENETRIAIPSYEGIAEMLPSILASGTQRCPLCGQEGMHEHSPKEIVIYRNGVKYGRALPPESQEKR